GHAAQGVRGQRLRLPPGDLPGSTPPARRGRRRHPPDDRPQSPARPVPESGLTMDAFVQTVTGRVPAETVGFILGHEHAGIGSYSRPGRDPWEMWSVINDEDILTDELQRFRDAGGGCLVDLTNV